MARRLAAAAAVLGLVAGLVLVPAVTTAQSAPGTLREGLAPQRRVDLRSAPQADLAHRHAPPVLPRLSRPAAAGAAAPKAAGPSVVVPPSPAFATSSGAAAAVVDHAFAGLDDQNTGACSTPNCPEPPDPWVAVGPNDIVQIVNFTVRVTDRDGGHVVTYDLDTFFDTAAISGTAFAAGDGRILYDSYHQRWIASEISIDCGDGNLAHQLSGPIGFNHIMVSDTSDPRGGWTIHGWKIYGGLPDYPGLGTSRDKIVQSANAFFLGSGSGVDCLNNAGGFAGTKLVAWNWSLNAASAVPAFNTGFDLTRFDWRPAAAAPALSTDASVYTVGLGGALADDDVYYGVLTGTPGATLSFTSSGHGLDLTTLGTVATVSDPDPPKPGQPGSPASLSKFAVDARITDAVWQAGRLWFVSTYTCLPPGGDGVTMHDCTRVTKLHTNGTAAPSRLDDFLLSAPDRDTFMGGVGVDGNGTLHVVYSRSSTAGGDFISSASVYQRASDAAGTVSAEAAIAAGAGTYTLSAGRWGDYVGVPIDPTDTGVVWQADEYANASGGWSTKVARLTAPGGVRRLSGTDRYATGIAISTGGFEAPVPAVFIATGLNFPDALAGAAIAGQLGAPVLLVPAGGSLPANVTQELGRLKPHDIYVLGGPSVVSSGIATQLGAYVLGGAVQRLWGANRYATAAAISAWFRTHGTLTTGGHVFVATGTNFPDALAGGPLAARNGSPILLVTPTTVPTETQAELALLAPTDITILGGPGAVSEAVRTQLAAANFGGDTSKVFRLSGANRYETAAAIESAADWLGEAWSPGVALAFVATGLNFPDALAGAALAGADDGPILLVAANTPIPAASDTALGALDPHGIIIFGGPGVVSDAIMAALAGYLAP